SMASFSFVPTPSVPDTSTGEIIFNCDKSNAAPKPPRPPITSGRIVRFTCPFICSTASYPALISTSAFLYCSYIVILLSFLHLFPVVRDRQYFQSNNFL